MTRVLLLLACLVSLPAAATAATITEWPVPWPDTRPRDPSVAPDGRIWFVGQRGNYLAVFDPATESFARHDLPEGTAPHTVVVDGDGHPWIAGNGNGTILRFDPATETFDTHVVPETEGVRRRDPHTFAFDDAGALWFTMQRGNAIGRIDMDSGAIRVIPVPTDGALPYGILATDSGRAWAVLLGTNKIAKVEPGTLELTEIALPREQARPRRIGLTDDGRVWYGDFTQAYIGAYDPATGEFEEWKTPSARSGPYAMTTDDDGRVWFVETNPQPNLLQGFDPATGKFLPPTPIPSASVRMIAAENPGLRRSWRTA